MSSKSAQYRKKLKEKNPEQYELYLQKQREAGAARRQAPKDEPLTRSKELELEKKRERHRLHQARYVAKKKGDSRSTLRHPPQDTMEKTSCTKRPKDMSQEERRLHYNRLKAESRARQHPQKQRQTREKARIYMQDKRAAEKAERAGSSNPIPITPAPHPISAAPLAPHPISAAPPAPHPISAAPPAPHPISAAPPAPHPISAAPPAPHPISAAPPAPHPISAAPPAPHPISAAPPAPHPISAAPPAPHPISAAPPAPHPISAAPPAPHPISAAPPAPHPISAAPPAPHPISAAPPESSLISTACVPPQPGPSSSPPHSPQAAGKYKKKTLYNLKHKIKKLLRRPTPKKSALILEGLTKPCTPEFKAAIQERAFLKSPTRNVKRDIFGAKKPVMKKKKVTTRHSVDHKSIEALRRCKRKELVKNYYLRNDVSRTLPHKMYASRRGLRMS